MAKTAAQITLGAQIDINMNRALCVLHHVRPLSRSARPTGLKQTTIAFTAYTTYVNSYEHQANYRPLSSGVMISVAASSLKMNLGSGLI